jgi:hypothetical protein
MWSCPCSSYIPKGVTHQEEEGEVGSGVEMPDEVNKNEARWAGEIPDEVKQHWLEIKYQTI